MKRLLPLLAIILVLPFARAQEAPLVESIGGQALHGWSWLVAGKTGTGGPKLAVPGAAEFQYPDGPRGAYKHGFREFNDGTRDWHSYYGVLLDVKLPDDHPVDLAATVLPPRDPKSNKPPQGTSTKVSLINPGLMVRNLTRPLSTT